MTEDSTSQKQKHLSEKITHVPCEERGLALPNEDGEKSMRLKRASDQKSCSLLRPAGERSP